MPTLKEVVADILDEGICFTRDDAIDLIEALGEQGYVIVPIEPTTAMLKAGNESNYDCREGLSIFELTGYQGEGLTIIYRAMLGARDQ